MSKAILRENKTCENCGNLVEIRFCSSCGQENTESKKSFHYLFTHFIEDLIHYDNGFWKAIKHLIFSPYILTIEYLKGKRKEYVAPVKLFIFMNFLCFFITGILVQDSDSIVKLKDKTNNKIETIEIVNQNKADSDFFTEKINKLDKKYSPQEIFEKAGENIKHYFPKVVFAYLPLFAFSLWLFHDKKKWWYFDHGIFTFHFFSAIMLLISIHALIDFILYKTELFFIQGLFQFILFLYIIYLFYKSHRKLFLETKFKSFMKATSLLLINFFLMGIIAIILVIISVMYIK